MPHGVFKPSTTGTLRNVDDATLRNMIYNYGPVIVGMDGAFFNFQAYKSGVLNPRCGGANHAVNVVGYATTGPGAPYWIGKKAVLGLDSFRMILSCLYLQSEKLVGNQLGRGEWLGSVFWLAAAN